MDFSWKGYNNQGMGSIFTCNLVRHKLSPDNHGKGYSIMQINRCNFSTGTVCPVYIARSGENQGKWNKGGTSLTPNDRCRFNHSPLLLIKLCRQPPSPPPPNDCWIVSSWTFLISFFPFSRRIFLPSRKTFFEFELINEIIGSGTVIIGKFIESILIFMRRTNCNINILLYFGKDNHSSHV